MKEKEILFRLLYCAFIEIREEAINVENKKIHLISDLFHQVPLQLDSEQAIDSILKNLDKRAEILKIKGWLDNVKNQL